MRAIEDKELEKQVAKQYHLENADKNAEINKKFRDELEAYFGTPETHNAHARMHELDMQFENERYVCSDCEIVFKDEVHKCPYCYGETHIDDKDCFSSQNSL